MRKINADDPRTRDPGPIVDAAGRPARGPTGRCPRCGATERVLSGGFGDAIHDVCRQCGYAFAERSH